MNIEFDKVSELVNKTGCSYEEAKYAYEACGGDMLSAIIMLEKAKKESGSGYYSYSDPKEKFKDNARRAAGKAGTVFAKLCRNDMKVVGRREYFSIPMIAAIILAAIIWEALIPIVLISLICGVSFVFTGPDLEKDITFGFTKNNKNKTAASETVTAIPRPEVKPAQYYYEGEQDNGFFNK